MFQPKVHQVLNKIVTWLRDHVFFIIAAGLLLVLIVGFSAAPSDFSRFNEALTNMRRHYKKSEKAVSDAHAADEKRQAKADKQLSADTKKADDKLAEALSKVDVRRSHVESETKKALHTDRQKVAHDIQEDLGL